MDKVFVDKRIRSRRARCKSEGGREDLEMFG